MDTMKSISREAIPGALEKATKYRLLNEPWDAESICLDVLAVEPGNQQALIILLLARTDQFAVGMPMEEARELLHDISSDYQREYYSGIMYERQAKAVLKRGTPRAQSYAYNWIREAMLHFENAIGLRPVRNDEAVLRWNACLRIIARDKLAPREENRVEQMLE